MKGDLNITAELIFSGLWRILTIPKSGLGLTAPQREALRVILCCRGGEEFITARPESEIAGLLRCLWESAHTKPAREPRKNLLERCWETHVAFRIMRGSSCAHRTEDERILYWREGCWPKEMPLRSIL
jgi:hypothetical protein